MKTALYRLAVHVPMEPEIDHRPPVAARPPCKRKTLRIGSAPSIACSRGPTGTDVNTSSVPSEGAQQLPKDGAIHTYPFESTSPLFEQACFKPPKSKHIKQNSKLTTSPLTHNELLLTIPCTNAQCLGQPKLADGPHASVLFRARPPCFVHTDALNIDRHPP